DDISKRWVRQITKTRGHTMVTRDTHIPSDLFIADSAKIGSKL
ncbi:2066_t:CDS:1, partial [Acaulospora morrowiae]